MGCNSSIAANNDDTITPRPTTATNQQPQLIPPKTAGSRISLQSHARSNTATLNNADINKLYGSKRSSTDMRRTHTSHGSTQFVNVLPSVQSIRLLAAPHRPNTSIPALNNNNNTLLVDYDRMQLNSRRGIPLISDEQIDTMKSNVSVIDEQTKYLDTSSGEFNYCDPLIFTGRMNDTFMYYSKSNEYIDKKGITMLATDCINYTYHNLQQQIRNKHNNWPTDKINNELQSIVKQYLPGTNKSESIEIVEYYFKSELRSPHDKHISRDQFFLKFTSVHTLLFSSTITVEREQLIERLNKQYVNRQKAYIESIKNPRTPIRELPVNMPIPNRRNSNKNQRDSLLQSPSSIMLPVNQDNQQYNRSTKRRSHRHRISNTSD